MLQTFHSNSSNWFDELGEMTVCRASGNEKFMHIIWILWCGIAEKNLERNSWRHNFAPRHLHVISRVQLDHNTSSVRDQLVVADAETIKKSSKSAVMLKEIKRFRPVLIAKRRNITPRNNKSIIPMSREGPFWSWYVEMRERGFLPSYWSGTQPWTWKM